jgi:hypothetical protein
MTGRVRTGHARMEDARAARGFALLTLLGLVLLVRTFSCRHLNSGKEPRYLQASKARNLKLEAILSLMSVFDVPEAQPPVLVPRLTSALTVATATSAQPEVLSSVSSFDVSNPLATPY